MDYLLTAVKGTTRFDMARFVAFQSGTFDPLNSYLIEAVMKLPKAGEYTVADDVNRPDMICAAIYNNDMQYWWLLLIYNNLWDATDGLGYPIIPNGTVLSYFSVDDVERLYFTLRAKQLANGT